MPRIFPVQVPATTKSPTCNVPFCTRTVARGPLPLSSFASIMLPFAERFGFAFSSRISDTRSIVSRSSFTPSPVFALTYTTGVVPPHASGTRSYSVSCCKTLSGCAPGLSILFTATIIETPAVFAWLIASTVCGIMPSSAATTMTAMSVTSAPLKRMLVNASCPGVSRNVMFLPFSDTVYAPICCVMPPASPDATLLFLM